MSNHAVLLIVGKPRLQTIGASAQNLSQGPYIASGVLAGTCSSVESFRREHVNGQNTAQSQITKFNKKDASHVGPPFVLTPRLT